MLAASHCRPLEKLLPVVTKPLYPTGKIIKGSHTNVTDAAFAEGKEIIGGYFIVNAADYDEAVALCEDYPDYENGGAVIVRQVIKMDMPS